MAARKQYIKPEISSVVLIPDEAVLGECKTALGLGPSGTGANCVDNNCQTPMS